MVIVWLHNFLFLFSECVCTDKFLWRICKEILHEKNESLSKESQFKMNVIFFSHAKFFCKFHTNLSVHTHSENKNKKIMQPNSYHILGYHLWKMSIINILNFCL